MKRSVVQCLTALVDDTQAVIDVTKMGVLCVGRKGQKYGFHRPVITRRLAFFLFLSI